MLKNLVHNLAEGEVVNHSNILGEGENDSSSEEGIEDGKIRLIIEEGITDRKIRLDR